MARTTNTVTRPTTRPSLAEMKAALAARQPNVEPVQTESEPIGILIGRKLSDVPKFFDAVVTGYRFYR